MKVPGYWRLNAVLILLMVVFSAHRIMASEVAADPLQELKGSFPDSTKMNVRGEKSIEFCPDNTCDYFVAGKEISVETLKDFAYLYVFFFSDYFVLDEWRNRKESVAIAKKILSKSDYRDCKKNEEDAARCILRKLAQTYKVKLYFVRYDEGKRNLVPEDIFAKTERSRLKSKPNLLP
jgi:hypothetical protein